MGPYVDALGTDCYLLTFTAPVLSGGVFLGVVGADVPVSRFERKLLGAWRLCGESRGQAGDAGADVLIINSQGRVGGVELRERAVWRPRWWQRIPDCGRPGRPDGPALAPANFDLWRITRPAWPGRSRDPPVGAFRKPHWRPGRAASAE